MGEILTGYKLESWATEQKPAHDPRNLETTTNTEHQIHCRTRFSQGYKTSVERVQLHSSESPFAREERTSGKSSRLAVAKSQARKMEEDEVVIQSNNFCF